MWLYHLKGLLETSYTYYILTTIGFSNEKDEHLMSIADFREKERNRNVVVVLDEVHIKEGFVYDKHQGSLISFANLGEVSDHLLRFEDECYGKETPKQLAGSMVYSINDQRLISQTKFSVCPICSLQAHDHW